MLNLYISHAAADRKTLDKLLIWLKPLEEKYFLRIWYDKPLPKPKPLPIAWQMLLFWYKPPVNKLPYNPDLPVKVREGHIYLFLTSYNSLASPHINQIEIPAAADRLIQNGENLVRIFPVVVSPSQWKKDSRLAGFKPLGPEGGISKSKPEEDAFNQIIDELEPIIGELRQNWIEENKRLGLPTDTFFKQEAAALPGSEPSSLPAWSGWLLLFGIIYFVSAWFTTYCAPNMYHRYKPERSPFESQPRPYFRENPYRLPDTTNLPPVDEPANKRF
jgi:hypothetical protein